MKAFLPAALVAAIAMSATALALPAAAQTVAITGGTVAIGDGSEPIPNGVVVLRDGRIVAAGRVAVPPGATIVDATGKWVSAGIVAGASDLGLLDADGVQESNDLSAGQAPFHAALDLSTAINPNSVAIANERAGGVTRALLTPAASGAIFAGQGAVIDLGDDPDPVTKPRAFQYVELGEAGARAAGGSRPAAYAYFREAIAQAQAYRRNPLWYEANGRDSLMKRGDAQAVLAVLEGRTRLFVHVERASDIRQVLTLKRDFPELALTLVGVSEGWLVARELAAARVPVIAAGLSDLPEAFETVAATESNAGRMIQAGVSVGISTLGYNDAPGEHVVRQFAGNLVGIARIPGATGLTWGQAFATITSGPAAAAGLDGEIGSLRPGRRADVVVWDGDPLELNAAPAAVFIDGRQQPLGSRQRQLRDRYLNANEGALPKAYER